MNIVYIFGIGASKSIDYSVPVMADFFEKTISMLDEENKTLWIAFAFAEEARVFASSPSVENLGIKIGVLGRILLSESKNKKVDVCKKVIDTELSKTIKLYKEAFLDDEQRRKANLECVLSDLEVSRETNNNSDNAYIRFLFVINKVCKDLDEKLSCEFKSAAHHSLANLIAEKSNIYHTFISFNYDLWLEKALFEKRLWYPRDGHGYVFKYYSQPTPGEFKNGDLHKPTEFTCNGNASTVKVLKPHGSLSWIFRDETSVSSSYSADKEKTKKGIVLVEKYENSCVAYNPTWSFPSAHLTEGTLLSLSPLIVPPIQTKRRSHPIFWHTDKDIIKALQTANIVVVIGWSMPITDTYVVKDLISNIINNRERQIEKLIVCDFKREQSFYSRFETIFRPIKVVPWDEGFSNEFVEFLKAEIEGLRNKR